MCILHIYWTEQVRHITWPHHPRQNVHTGRPPLGLQRRSLDPQLGQRHSHHRVLAREDGAEGNRQPRVPHEAAAAAARQPGRFLGAGALRPRPSARGAAGDLRPGVEQAGRLLELVGGDVNPEDKGQLHVAAE